MRSDTRLSRMLHVLIHMVGAEGPMTSEAIADMLATNPVVVRRTMAGLRDKGYVGSTRGHGGGWVLRARPEAISLADIYEALGAPGLFAMGLGDRQPDCLIEQGVQTTLGKILADASEMILSRLRLITLADMMRDFDRRARQLGLERADYHAAHAPRMAKPA